LRVEPGELCSECTDRDVVTNKGDGPGDLRAFTRASSLLLELLSCGLPKLRVLAFASMDPRLCFLLTVWLLSGGNGRAEDERLREEKVR